jgi:hypothetical protein
MMQMLGFCEIWVRHKRQNGTKLGRRRVHSAVEAQIREQRAKRDGILKIARTLGIGTSVVQRVVLETI